MRRWARSYLPFFFRDDDLRIVKLLLHNPLKHTHLSWNYSHHSGVDLKPLVLVEESLLLFEGTFCHEIHRVSTHLCSKEYVSLPFGFDLLSLQSFDLLRQAQVSVEDCLVLLSMSASSVLELLNLPYKRI